MRRSRGHQAFCGSARLWRALCVALLLCVGWVDRASGDRLSDLALEMTDPSRRVAAEGSSGEGVEPVVLSAATTSLASERRPLGRISGEAQPLPEASSGGSWWLLETAGALGCVIGVIFIARFAYQKFSGQSVVAGAHRGDVEVLSRTTIAPRNQIVLLRVAGRVLVCSDSAQGMCCLSEITDEQEVAGILGRSPRDAELRPSQAFSEVLTDLENEPAEEEAVEAGVDKARDDLSRLLSRVRAAKEGGWVA
ncbi:FliO/MopB family protein [Mucisphaera calidilacus]|uniref:Uncharacterized protein n=1 Tax=Mucisphaera calidilacus TaxID=2527982 RepID=A0A518BYW3_9BACT|nr:flagellar biosynthetic protein FliO [Mucisphaera calidilacus]QDU72167.1 hypothetical protein Pan265_20300 [Mucisphaera calidilacus]